MADNWKPQLCYTDTGGTFTDTFIVNEEGDFILGKAPTTPEDVSIGYFNSVADAAGKVGLSGEEIFSELRVAGYGATTVINTLVERKGARLGLIITKGFEGYLLMERGGQTFSGYTLPDRLHAVTHIHNEPLIPKKRIRGVTERTNMFGVTVIPLYEQEAEDAVRELLEMDIEGLVICFLYSFLNPGNEIKAADIARQVMKNAGREIPVYLSSEINPVMREFPRLNSTLIEAYAGAPSRKPLITIDEKIKQFGFKRGDLQILLSYGGLASVRHAKMVETMESGPVGGVIGAKYVGELYGFENIVATDVGGTTFDVGMISSGVVAINREPDCARFRLGIPMIEVTSIGAGGGTIIKYDRMMDRLEIGPESAGAFPGPICYNQGGEDPTITDVDLILGYLNPAYFLGGRITLNKDKALKIFEQKIAKPLGVGVLEAAEGVKDIIDTRMRGQILGMLYGKGYNTNDYHLLSYGGAGPTHVAGYTKDLDFAGVLAFPFSSVFSAFGASASNYEHLYTKSCTLMLPPGANDDAKMWFGQSLNGLWKMLEDRGREDMEREGYTEEQVHFEQLVMVRYRGQLDDLIVSSPVARIESPEDCDRLIHKFEDLYEKIYARAAKYPDAGYLVLEVGVRTFVEKLKPKLKKYPLKSKKPLRGSLKGYREAVFSGKLQKTAVYELDNLLSGNELAGPAIVEHPTTTMVVPPDHTLFVDEYKTLWLRR
jgi:N-methylhydantoinase A/oxoprolinase/acetone carboxylase beta subunit